MQTPPDPYPIPSLLSSDCESSLNPEVKASLEDGVESPKSHENQAAESGVPERSLSVPEENGGNECTTSRKESDTVDPKTSSIDDECPRMVESGDPQSPSAKGQDDSMAEKKKKKKAEQKQIVEHPTTPLSLPESLRNKRRYASMCQLNGARIFL